MINLNNLFKRISDLGLNQTQVSEGTKISNGNISDWKNGKSLPTARALYSLANYLDCSIDYLLGRTNNPKIQAPINSVLGSTINNSVVQSGNSASITLQSNDTSKQEISKQAAEIIRIFESLDARKQMKFFSIALEFEEKE